jgi:hypothetical protein
MYAQINNADAVTAVNGDLGLYPLTNFRFRKSEAAFTRLTLLPIRTSYPYTSPV